MDLTAYILKGFRKKSHDLIAEMQTIADRYTAKGFTLSVRQLYYQLVTVNTIENTMQAYDRVQNLCTEARLAGIFDWDAIEDRGRDIVHRAKWESPVRLLQAAAEQYHEDAWDTQARRVFVVVEKDALSGVLGPVCKRWDVPLLAAKGYCSVSTFRELALDYVVPAIEAEQEPLILHLADHDPSGIDMTRDLEERLALFCEHHAGMAPTVHRIALSLKQVKALKLPPNPAKLTDSRAKKYIEQFGGFGSVGAARSNRQQKIPELFRPGNGEAVEGKDHNIRIGAVRKGKFHCHATWTCTGIVVGDCRFPRSVGETKRYRNRGFFLLKVGRFGHGRRGSGRCERSFQNDALRVIRTRSRMDAE